MRNFHSFSAFNTVWGYLFHDCIIRNLSSPLLLEESGDDGEAISAVHIPDGPALSRSVPAPFLTIAHSVLIFWLVVI